MMTLEQLTPPYDAVVRNLQSTSSYSLYTYCTYYGTDHLTFQTEEKPQLSDENLMINELIREYLQFNGYNYTRSVFQTGIIYPQCLSVLVHRLFPQKQDSPEKVYRGSL